MKKNILNILRNFFVNPFWTTWQVLAIIVISLLINALLWYIYFSKIRFNPTPFIFAAGLVGLNLILGNFLWEREKLAGYFLISLGLFVQFLMLIFIRYMMMSF